MNNKPTRVEPVAVSSSSLAGDHVVDRFIRILGVSILILLIAAYLTGEEFPHTHEMIGYGIAILLVAAVAWEFLQMRRSYAPETPSRTAALHSAAVGLLIILPILALLAATALVLMLVTHNFWGTTLVDEMHEVVAYFGLGLLAFYVATLVITGLATWRP